MNPKVPKGRNRLLLLLCIASARFVVVVVVESTLLSTLLLPQKFRNVLHISSDTSVKSKQLCCTRGRAGGAGDVAESYCVERRPAATKVPGRNKGADRTSQTVAWRQKGCNEVGLTQLKCSVLLRWCIYVCVWSCMELCGMFG